MWKMVSLALSFALHQPVPLCLVFRRTVTVLIWLHLPYIFSLRRLMSSDGANAFVSHSLSCRPPFNCCFSYSCRQKVVFAASLPCVSVTGILPALCVSGVVCVCERACLYVCVHVCLCVYVCASTSVESRLLLCQCQVWRMVPLVKDSLSRCTGLPTLFRRAKCLHLMLDLCYLSMKLQLRTSYTCGTGRVISSIPACGHEHKWSSLLLCHPILLLTCRQFLPSAVFEISNVVAHKVFVGWPYGQYSAWLRLAGIIPKAQMFVSPCHT